MMPEGTITGPRVGCWDQWCVLGDRPYNKDGELSLLDEQNCRQILTNFRRQKDDLPCNISHDKDRVVGTYNAMALFVRGVCVEMASHDPLLLTPTVGDLPGADNGAPPDDGIYWHRATLTRLGMAAAEGLRKISPEFFSKSKNSFDEPIGYQAVGGAWTNYPFLDGCEKHEFTRSEPMAAKKRTFAEDAGIGDKDDAPAKMSKLRAFGNGKFGAEKFGKMLKMAGSEGDDEISYARAHAYLMAKFEDDDDDKKGGGAFDVDPSNAAQNAAVHIKTGAEHSEPGSVTKGRGEDVKKKYEDPVVTDGAPTTIHEPSKSQNPVPGGGTSMSREGFARFAKELGLPEDPAAARAKLETQQAAAAALPDMNRKLNALVGKQVEFEATREAETRLQKDWREGRIKPRLNEDDRGAQQRMLNLFTKSGPAAYEAALLDENSYTPREQMLGRLSMGGLPIGAEPPKGSGGAQQYARPDEELARLGGLKVEEAKKAGRRLSHLDAVREVALEQPRIAQEYSSQSRMAFLEGLLDGTQLAPR